MSAAARPRPGERGQAPGAGAAQAPSGEATPAQAGGAGQQPGGRPAAGSGQSAAHGGVHAVAAAFRHGAQTMFTLSGGHVFPLYDGAVTADPPMRIVDVRHEQTAVFAAEATARLERTPGFAVLTAGPESRTASVR